MMGTRRDKATWNQNTAIHALITNVNRDLRKHPAAKPSDFHPYNAGRSKAVKDTKLAFALMRESFVGDRT